MLGQDSLWVYFSHAGMVVKVVMILLLVASIASWAIIFQRSMLLKQARKALQKFEDKFWSGIDLSRIYTDLSTRVNQLTGLEVIFSSGFKEFIRMRKQARSQAEVVMEGAQRAMRIARSREIDRLEQHLSILATIGSTSPYVGLFGTVWGIMTAFHALGNVQQATIAMVAPGISEALIATAMGLFAAIPAVIAYNNFSNEVARLENHYDTFQEEFSTILYRQAHNDTHTTAKPQPSQTQSDVTHAVNEPTLEGDPA